MRVQGLINRLQKIKAKYGNVEVLTMQRGKFAPPNPCWLIDGDRFLLVGIANEAKEKKCPITL